jgi:putative acetyltransferase
MCRSEVSIPGSPSEGWSSRSGFRLRSVQPVRWLIPPTALASPCGTTGVHGRRRPSHVGDLPLTFARRLWPTTRQQVEAWAANYGDLDSWAAARAAAHTQLAIVDGYVTGFTDLDDHGYIDMLFVDPDFGRHGVGSALLGSVVARARQRGLPALTTFASLTSRPVFERHGFVITGERYFGEGDRAAKTYAMRCVLAGTTAL